MRRLPRRPRHLSVRPTTVRRCTPTNVADTCGKCHRFIEERLKKSVHGRANGPGQLAEGRPRAGKQKKTPTCTACHQGHDLQDPESAAFRLQLPNRCGNCHADLSSRYAMSMHGQLTELGYGPAAKCSDCHGAHDILPVNDPDSRLSARIAWRRAKTAIPTRCQGFADFDPHADHNDPERNPAAVLRSTSGMEMLLFSVFGFFGLHTRAVVRRGRWSTRSRTGGPSALLPGQPAYVRFEPIHRLLHVIVHRVVPGAGADRACR